MSTLIVESAALGFWVQAAAGRSAIVAATLSVMASMALIAALYVEHLFYPSPSLLLGFYYSVVALFNGVKARSLAIRPGLETIFAASVASAALALLVVISQEWSKRSLLLDRRRQHTMSMESLAGFWSRSIFWWVNFTLMKGFVSIFYTDDLPNMEDDLAAKNLYKRFNEKWRKGKATITYTVILHYN